MEKWVILEYLYKYINIVEKSTKWQIKNFVE